MALKECDDCGNKVSTEAAKCPHCGKPNREITSNISREQTIILAACLLYSIIWLKPLLGHVYRLFDGNAFVCKTFYCLRMADPYNYSRGELYYCPLHIEPTTHVNVLLKAFYYSPGLQSLVPSIVFGLGGIILLMVPRLRKKLLNYVSSL